MFHDDEVSNERGKPFVYDVAFSYDAKRLLVGGRDGVGRIWDCNIEDTFYVAKLLINARNTRQRRPRRRVVGRRERIATASEGPDVQGLLGEEGRILSVLQGHEGQVTSTSPRARPTGDACPTGGSRRPCPWRRASRDATIRFWRVAPETRGLDPEEGSRERHVRGHSAGPRRPDQWHRVRRGRLVPGLGGLRPQGHLGTSSSLASWARGATGAVLDDATGGRAGGGWRLVRVVCCFTVTRGTAFLRPPATRRGSRDRYPVRARKWPTCGDLSRSCACPV